MSILVNDKCEGVMMTTTKNQVLKIARVTTEAEASKLADLYISYYKKLRLTKDSFLKRWKVVNSHENYYIFTACLEMCDKPVGFMNFTIIPSIFWAPSLARIDSVYVVDDNGRESEITDALFEQALLTMKQHKVSIVIGVSCSTYDQELRILNSKLTNDDNPEKKFFIRSIT